MCIKLDILKYLQILNHSTPSLDYISRLLDIHNKYSIDDIRTFYTQYSFVTKDIKVSSKLSLSINYVLTNNIDMLRIIDDDFFIQLLTDYEDNLILQDDLQLRLVSFINTHTCYNPYILRYITKYKNKLDFSELTVKHVKNSVSYFMRYTGFNTEIIQQISLKSRDKNFKKELDKYINTQGCINNILLYNCIIQNIKVFYISNIDIKECRKRFCYKHLVEYLNKSKMLQRYFIREKSLEIIFRYPEYISVQNFIRIIEEKSIQSDLFNLFSNEEIILIFYIFRKKYNEEDSLLILDRCKEYSDLFLEFCLTHGINIFEHKQNYLQGDIIYKGVINNKGYTNNNLQENRLHKEYTNNNLKENGLHKEYTNINLQENGLHKGYTNNNLQENVNNKEYTNNNLQDKEIIKYRKISVTNSDYKEISSFNSQILLNLLQSDKKTCINILIDKDIVKDEIFNFLDLIFIKYDFKFIYEVIIEIINLHGKTVIDRIQIFLLDILEEGFFEECYFDMIKNIYNKLLLYSSTIKTKKNNDSILILLSRYCKHFDKEIYLGNIKNYK